MKTTFRTDLSVAHRTLLQSLLAQVDGVRPAGREVGEVPAEHYTSREHFAREQAGLFARMPQVVAVERELEPGSMFAVEMNGLSLLLTRNPSGALAGFKNACRHRSTRLVEPGGPVRAKAIVCPYHGWTYDFAGCRVHAPHVETFCGADQDRTTLEPVHVAVREGFVLASLEEFEIDRFIAPIAFDLAALECAHWQPYRRVVHDVRANWKLVIDAFLDGYHIRHLHRDTLYPFFLDGCFDAETAGLHIRTLVGRRALVEARHDTEALRDLCRVATPSYLLFPNTILIVHPDYLSVGVSMPIDVDRTRFVHLMLIPEAPRTEKEERHWTKSLELIDRGVFAGEDLKIVEEMQRGLETGANRSQLFGEQEFPALWFHRRLAETIVDVQPPLL